MKFNSLVAVLALGVLVVVNGQTTEEHRHPFTPITFECSPELVQLLNESKAECRQAFPKFNRTEATTEASVDKAPTEGDALDDDELSTGPTPQDNDRMALRFERRQRRRQKFHMFKTCIYNKIKGNSQVAEIQSQCDQLVSENTSMPEEIRPMKSQFCVTGTVFRNCLPWGENKRRRGPGMRRRMPEN